MKRRSRKRRVYENKKEKGVHHCFAFFRESVCGFGCGELKVGIERVLFFVTFFVRVDELLSFDF